MQKQSNYKGLTPAIGDSPNFLPDSKKFYRTAIISNNRSVLWKYKYLYYNPDLNNKSLVRLSQVDYWYPNDSWNTLYKYLFDDRGLVSQITDKNGIPTSILWGYSGKYKIVTAQNVLFSQLKKVIGNLGIVSCQKIRDSYNIDTELFDKLKIINSYIPGALVNVYKYTPNKGITEYVKPNSLHTFYSFDGYGRLTEIYDNDKNIVGKAEYGLNSILPLTANFSDMAKFHINENMRIRINANGGSGQYLFDLSVKALDGKDMYKENNNTGLFTISPQKAGLIADSDYMIECIVTDLISEEVVTINDNLHINNAIIYFNDTYNDIDIRNGNAKLFAKIYSDSATKIKVRLSFLAPNSCTLKIGNYKNTFKGKKSDIDIITELKKGISDIEVSFSETYTEGFFSLEIIDVENHDIGQDNYIEIMF